MPNYLHPMQAKYRKVQKALEQAVEMLERGEECPAIAQTLKVPKEFAAVFADKPVVIVQSINVQIIKVNNAIQEARRLLDEIDIAVYREAATRNLIERRGKK